MFPQLTLSQKLLAGFGVILLIILVLIGLARNGFSQITDSTEWNIHTYKVLDGSGILLTGLTNIETGMRGFALSGKDDFLEPLHKGKADFDKAWNELKGLTADNPTQQKRLDEIKATQQTWLAQDIDPTLALRREVVAGQRSMDDLVARIVARGDKVKMDKMRALIAEFQGDESKLLATRSRDLQSDIRFANWSLIVSGLLAALAASAIAMSLGATIRRRLRTAMEIAQNIAGGRLDTQIDARAKDEIGALINEFAAMQNRLRAMIAEIKSGATALLASAQDISRTSESLSSAAHEQSNSASAMAATVEQLTVSISHVANSASEAHGISTASGNHSVEGGAVIQDTLQSMTRIAGTVQSSAEQISELGRNIEQISSIVSVITSIAEQTNLLALNAAIEAARAGDQGRGFAVVADEVRSLAQRTGQSTFEIGEMIQKIQLSAKDAVRQMGVGVEQVHQGVELANAANSAIEQIRDGSGRIIEVVDQISLALNEQTVASQDVARSVERIAQMAQTSSQSIVGATQVAANIEALAHNLDRQVAQFKL